MRVATSRLLLLLASAATATVARTEAAYAQQAPTMAPASDAGAAVDPPADPPPPALVPATPPAGPVESAALPASPPIPPVESPALTAPTSTSAPAIHVGARLRAAGRYYSLNGGPNGSAVDSTYAELRASGEIREYVTLTLSLYSTGSTVPIGLEDAIIAFDLADPVHLWIGQTLVPADRGNLGGPFSAIPWNFYQGVLAYGATTRVVAVPRGNSIGRDGGGVLWGDLAEKKLHYALSAFLPSAGLPGSTPSNSPPVAQTALLSARLSVDILGKENGYIVKSSYSGEQDVVAIGIGGQFQKGGSLGVAPTNATGTPIGPPPSPDDYAEFNSDLLVEMRIGGGAYFTLDGAYYHYVGSNEPMQDEVSILGAIATPKLGIGNLQPYGRWQWFSPRANSTDFRTFAVDAGLNYLIKGPALRIMLAYEHVDLGNHQLSDVGQLAAQAMFY
jgi:hypothetical protein